MKKNTKQRLVGGTVASVAMLAGAAFAFSPSSGSGMFLSSGGTNGTHRSLGGMGGMMGSRMEKWADRFIKDDLTDEQKQELEILRGTQKQETKDLIKEYADKLLPYIDENKLEDYKKLVEKVDDIGAGGLIGIGKIFMQNRPFLKADLTDVQQEEIKAILGNLRIDFETLRKSHMGALIPYINEEMLSDYEDIINYPLIYGMRGGVINGFGINGMFKDDLTDEEKAQLNTLIEEHKDEMVSLMANTMEEMKTMRDEQFQELEQYVDPDKLDEFEQMVDQRPMMRGHGFMMGRGFGGDRGGEGRGQIDGK